MSIARSKHSREIQEKNVFSAASKFIEIFYEFTKSLWIRKTENVKYGCAVKVSIW